MSRVPSIRSKFIDGGFLFNYYFTIMGTAHSQRKLPQVAKENGMVNYLGKPPSVPGCWKAMWNWASEKENHQKAYEIYNNHLMSVGQFITVEDFMDLLRKQTLTSKQFPTEGYAKRYFKREGLE